MNNELSKSGSWREESVPLFTRIRELEERIDTDNLLYGGLKDLGDYLELIQAKLDLALLLFNHPDSRDSEERVKLAGTQAREALMQTDSLNNENISLDQKDEITDAPEMAEIREKLQRLVLLGGAALFEVGDTRRLLVRKVSSALRKALFKYTGGQHQLTGERSVKEDHLARYEIPEGDEDILLSDRMVLPLSQAIVLIEDEILPAVEKKLEENPGEPQLLARKNRLEEQLAEFKSAKFFPRARPHTAEKDLFTASLAGFNADGEALVTVGISTVQSSGNTYDHLLQHLRVEIIRDCAGAGVSRKLDEQLQGRHSPRAGRKYALLDSLNNLDVAGMFRVLSMDYPFLRRIENREDLKLLADLAASGRKSELNRLIAGMVMEDTNILSAGADKLQLPENGE